MTQYRDETESLRARVTELEGKLASAEAEAAKLRGETTAPVADSKRDAFVGEPLHFVSELELPFQVTEAGYEAIANLVRERRNTQVSQVGRSLTAPHFSLTAGEGWTRIRLETDLRHLRRTVLVAGPTLSTVFTTLPLTGIMVDVAAHGGTSPWHLAWLIPSTLIAGMFGMRALAGRHARTGRATHEGVFAGIQELAEKHRAKPAAVAQVRVEAPEEEAEDAVERAEQAERGRQAR